jgi:hypothetical protein
MTDQVQSEQPQGDSGSLSVSDRIANIFGGDEPQEPQAPEQQASDEPQEPVAEDQGQPPETFELEYDGEKFVLPKKLEKGFLQERDYTQKAQTLAEQRRSVELKEQQFRVRELQDKFNTEVANDVRQMQMIDAVLEQPVNWQSMSTDEAFRHKIQLDDLRQQREKLAQAVTQRWQKFQGEKQSSEQELQRKTLEAVRTRINGWNDAVAKEVTDHFRERGLTEADFALFNQNPVYVEAAWKAMQYDKLQAKAKPAVEQAKNAKTTSAKPMPKDVQDKLNYRKAVAKAAPGSQEQQRLVKDRLAKIFG